MDATRTGNTLTYKNYSGTIEYSEPDGVYHGRVIGIRASLFYEGDTIEALTADFRDAIDEYLELCKERGVEPQRALTPTCNDNAAISIDNAQDI